MFDNIVFGPTLSIDEEMQVHIDRVLKDIESNGLFVLSVEVGTDRHIESMKLNNVKGGGYLFVV